MFICTRYNDIWNICLHSCVCPFFPECTSDCQRCTADLQTGIGSICLWCKVQRNWLLGDHCVAHCPQSHYAWHGACMSKDVYSPAFIYIHYKFRGLAVSSCHECKKCKKNPIKTLMFYSSFKDFLKL